MRLILAFTLVAFSLSQSQPSPPIYPSQYSLQFFETQITSAGTGTTYGQAFYDSVNGLYRMDRFSGLTDIMCAGALPMTGDSSCSHLVVSNKRYMYYPYLNSCCYCCNSTDGCGILNQSWLSGAAYVGEEEVYDVPVYVWNQSGNFYYETAYSNSSLRTPVGLFRNNTGLLDYFEYIEYIPEVQSNAFTLPQECVTTQLCSGLCSLFRGSSELEFS